MKLPEKSHLLGSKQTTQGIDLESLDERIRRLLSLAPIGKHQFASTNLKDDPGNGIGKKLKAGTFSPACTLQLREAVPGLSYYNSYFNIQNKPLANCYHHYWGETNLEELKRVLPVGTNIVLHSHETHEYCPWKHGCHMALEIEPDDEGHNPVGYTKSRLPDWFIEMWSHVYLWNKEITDD